MRILILSTLLIGTAALTACGGSSKDKGNPNPPVTGGDPQAALIEKGQEVYSNRLEGGTNFACATCHALSEPASDGLRRAGHPIGDALRRQSYKNGQLNTFLEAANTCLTDWLDIQTPWTESTEEYSALVAYIEDQDTDNGAVQDVSFTITGESVPIEADNGDVNRGQTAFNATCASCHGEDALGGLDVGFALSGFDNSPEQIAKKVRTSGPSSADQPNSVYNGLTGGRMPFWSLERLSNQELGDIIAFLRSTVDNAGSSSSGGMSGSSSSGGNTNGCATNHPDVGKTTMLSTLQHDVSGLATIIDDCTIEITGFNYDGGGITVYVYGGLNGDYSDRDGGPGFLMGPNLVRSSQYINETLRVQLPSNKTLDDLDGVSIWCSDFNISFGDGLFN